MLVYKITNTVNGKVYVGQTRGDVNVRWHQHISDAKGNRKGCPVLYRAILKYGIDSFVVTPMYIASIQDELDYLEQVAIAQFKSLNPLYGYNLRSGGARGTFNAASRSKMSKSASRVRHLQWTPERRAKHSARMSGSNNPFYGKKLPDGQQAQMVEASKEQAKLNPVTRSQQARKASLKSWENKSLAERKARTLPMLRARWSGKEVMLLE